MPEESERPQDVLMFCYNKRLLGAFHMSMYWVSCFFKETFRRVRPRVEGGRLILCLSLEEGEYPEDLAWRRGKVQEKMREWLAEEFREIVSFEVSLWGDPG